MDGYIHGRRQLFDLVVTISPEYQFLTIENQQRTDLGRYGNLALPDYDD